jgi:cytochrome P450
MPRDGRTQVPDPVTVRPPEEPLGLWASYRAARRNILEMIPEPAYREPVLSGGRGAGWVMVQDPAWLEHVLKTREPDYPKSAVTKRILRPRRGENILTLEGQEWRWRHRAMTPMFQRRAIEAQAPAMAEAAGASAARIAGRAGGSVDLYPEMVRVTCDVIADVALSGREALDRQAITEGLTAFIRRIARISLLDILGAPEWVPRPGRLLDRHGPRIDAMMDRIVAARRARGPSEPPDLLDMLIAAEDPETGRRMDAVELRNNLLAFIAAGHETTALALAWALYLLAHDAAHGGGAQDRAREEVLAATGGGPVGAEHLPALGYVRQVIDESLRLYPPAGFMTRTARGEDEIAGHRVRPGTTVILPVYALHRHRLLWERPDAFDPGRFAPGAAQARPRHAYLPFGAGPRICLGMQFALIEAQIVLATLLSRVRVGLAGGFVPEPRMWFTLRPATGMPLRVERV